MAATGELIRMMNYVDDIADYEHALQQKRDTSDQDDLADPEDE